MSAFSFRLVTDALTLVLTTSSASQITCKTKQKKQITKHRKAFKVLILNVLCRNVPTTGKPHRDKLQKCRCFCKYSQFQHLTECALQHNSLTTSKTHDFKTTPATKGLALCLDATPWYAESLHCSMTPLAEVESMVKPEFITFKLVSLNLNLKPYTLNIKP